MKRNVMLNYFLVGLLLFIIIFIIMNLSKPEKYVMLKNIDKFPKNSVVDSNYTYRMYDDKHIYYSDNTDYINIDKNNEESDDNKYSGVLYKSKNRM